MIHGGYIQKDGLTVKIVTNKWDAERTFDSQQEMESAIDFYNNYDGDLEEAMEAFMDWDGEE